MTDRKQGAPVGNENRLVHGGERSVKALEKGRCLEGIAAELKEAVSAEIETRGLVAVLRERAERHQAVADLFYGLVLGADNVKDADSYVKRFGWLNAKAHKMLQEVAELEADLKADYYDILEQELAND